MMGILRKAYQYLINWRVKPLGCLHVFLWAVVIFSCFSFFILQLSSSQNLWLRNLSGETIIINACSLNGEQIEGCSQKLKNNEIVFFDPKHIEYHPEANTFSISVVADHKEYQYTCDFYREKTDCWEEIAVNTTGLSCEKYCSSVYG